MQFTNHQKKKKKKERNLLAVLCTRCHRQWLDAEQNTVDGSKSLSAPRQVDFLSTMILWREKLFAQIMSLH